MKNPVTLSYKHPHQGKLTYDEYVQAAEFHYDVQGLVVNHCYQFDNTNIQDTFISYLNHSKDIQQIVNHKFLLPLDSVKLNYSAGLFIHTIGGTVKCVQPKYYSKIFKPNFSLHLQIFNPVQQMLCLRIMWDLKIFIWQDQRCF